MDGVAVNSPATRADDAMIKCDLRAIEGCLARNLEALIYVHVRGGTSAHPWYIHRISLSSSREYGEETVRRGMITWVAGVDGRRSGGERADARMGQK